MLRTLGKTSHLRKAASNQTKLRDRLSGSRGTKAGALPEAPAKTEIKSLLDMSAQQSLQQIAQPTCAVLSFNMALIQGTTEIANERFANIYNKPEVQGDTVPTSFGHTACVWGKKMILLGGGLRSLYILDTEKMEWHLKNCTKK